MEEAEFCDHMVIMSRGEKLASGTPAAIRALAQTPARPEPSVEDAFVALAEGAARTQTEGARHG
jgi:ABC-2 type transport system ATP-binding protein